MTEPLEDWMTVAEAARLLDTTERTVRRHLARPENTAQTRQESRRTKTGTRQTTLVRAAFVTELSPQFQQWRNAAQPGGPNAAQTRQSTAFAGGQERGDLLAAYHLLIEAKDAELVRMQDNLQATQAALSKALDALAREQTLRAIASAPDTAAAQPQPETPADTAPGPAAAPEGAPWPRTIKERLAGWLYRKKE